MGEPAENAVHRAAVRKFLDEDEGNKDRELDANLVTDASEVLDDIRGQIHMAIQLRDQLQVLIRVEAPLHLTYLAHYLGHSPEEIKDAVFRARKTAKQEVDRYMLKHPPEVRSSMMEQFGTDPDDMDAEVRALWEEQWKAAESFKEYEPSGTVWARPGLFVRVWRFFFGVR
jgi:hypothetical protein